MRPIVLGLVAIFVACTRSEPGDAAPAEVEPAAAPVVEVPLHLPTAMREREWISIERTGCYGRCPQFTITATSAGSVEWIGKQDVNRLGPAYRVVDAAAIAEIYAGFAELDWLEIPQWSRGTEEDCATDAPSTIVTLGRGVVARTLDDYHGCQSEARTRMRALEKRLVELVAAPDWIGGDPWLRPEPEADPNADPTCRAEVFRPLFTARASAPWTTFSQAAMSAFSMALHPPRGKKSMLRIMAVASDDPGFALRVDRLTTSLQNQTYAYDSFTAKIVDPASTGPGPGEIRVIVTPEGCPTDDADLVPWKRDD